MDWIATSVTLRLATLTTLILVVVGLPLAYWLSLTKWRGRFLVESIVALPLVLPPTVLGYYLLVAMNPRHPIGQTYEGIVGHKLAFSFPGILLACVIANLPFMVRPFQAAFDGLDRRLLEASWCLGVSGWSTFWRIAIPLCWPGLFAGIVLTFAHTVGAFGVVLMVGGNIPGVTRTLSVAIYDDFQAMDYASAGRTSLVLLIAAMVLMSVTHFVQRPRSRR